METETTVHKDEAAPRRERWRVLRAHEINDASASKRWTHSRIVPYQPRGFRVRAWVRARLGYARLDHEAP